MSKVRLGDVAKEHKETCKGDKSDYPIVGLEHLEPECITLSQWSESTDNTFSKVFRKGHVLFGRRRAYLKKAAVAPFDGICSGDITVIEAIPGRIIPELLPFVIQNDALFDFAVGRSAGSLSPRVKWEHLKNYEFELPASEEEQCKLADVLWSIEQTRKSYNSLLRATDELVKSQFIELFGDEKKAVLSETKIQDVADVKVGIVIKPTQYYSDVPGIKAFRSTNIGAGYVKDSDWVYFSEEAMEITKRTIAREGDVLVVRSGYPGTCCVVSKEYDGCNVVDLLIARPNRQLIEPEFLSIFTNLPHGKNQIVAMQHGIAQKHFNVEMYKQLRIFLPCLEAQRTFVRFVQQLDKSKYADSWSEEQAAA